MTERERHLAVEVRSQGFLRYWDSLMHEMASSMPI